MIPWRSFLPRGRRVVVVERVLWLLLMILTGTTVLLLERINHRQLSDADAGGDVRLSQEHGLNRKVKSS